MKQKPWEKYALRIWFISNHLIIIQKLITNLMNVKAIEFAHIEVHVYIAVLENNSTAQVQLLIDPLVPADHKLLYHKGMKLY